MTGPIVRDVLTYLIIVRKSVLDVQVVWPLERDSSLHYYCTADNDAAMMQLNQSIRNNAIKQTK